MKDQTKRKVGRPATDNSKELKAIADEIVRDPSLSVMKAAKLAGIDIEKNAASQNVLEDSYRRRLERAYKRNEDRLLREAERRRNNQRSMSHTGSRHIPNSRLGSALAVAENIGMLGGHTAVMEAMGIGKSHFDLMKQTLGVDLGVLRDQLRLQKEVREAFRITKEVNEILRLNEMIDPLNIYRG